MKLITISGLDGSGKSTQLQLLISHLESQGKRVYYFHAIDFSIANKILGKKRDETGREISVARAGWCKIQLRKLALWIDIYRFKKLLSKLARRNGGLSNKNYDYVISDRYFYDGIVNIHYLSGKEGELSFEKNIVAPDLGIYLLTDPEKIMTRDRIPDQGLEYLKKKKDLFDARARDWNLNILEGDRPKEEIFENIKNLL